MDWLLPPSSSASWPILCEVGLTWTVPQTLLQVADHQPFPLISVALTQTCCGDPLQWKASGTTAMVFSHIWRQLWEHAALA